MTTLAWFTSARSTPSLLNKPPPQEGSRNHSHLQRLLMKSWKQSGTLNTSIDFLTHMTTEYSHRHITHMTNIHTDMTNNLTHMTNNLTDMTNTSQREAEGGREVTRI